MTQELRRNRINFELQKGGNVASNDAGSANNQRLLDMLDMDFLRLGPQPGRRP